MGEYYGIKNLSRLVGKYCVPNYPRTKKAVWGKNLCEGERGVKVFWGVVNIYMGV